MICDGQPFQREIEDAGREQGSGETDEGLGAADSWQPLELGIPVPHRVWGGGALNLPMTTLKE